MKKLAQRIRELQALINNPEFNEIIEEKLMDVWHDTVNEESKQYSDSWKEYCRRLNASLSRAEKEKMDDSHMWRVINNEGESDCPICHIDEFSFFQCPQYCEPKNQKNEKV